MSCPTCNSDDVTKWADYPPYSCYGCGHRFDTISIDVSTNPDPVAEAIAAWRKVPKDARERIVRLMEWACNPITFAQPTETGHAEAAAALLRALGDS